jgi:hypothetical protein
LILGCAAGKAAGRRRIPFTVDSGRRPPTGQRGEPMLTMMRYRLGSGEAGRRAYERFSKWAPEEGFEIKGGWTTASNEGGFLLLETADVERLLAFSAQDLGIEQLVIHHDEGHAATLVPLADQVKR